MMIPQIITAIAILFCTVTQNNENRGWMGIIPLHSSNADVIEKLGFPNGGPLVTYKFDKVNVDIDYSSSEPCHSGWNLPEGTVLHITLHVKQNPKPKFSELNLDLSQYEKRGDVELLDITYYENKKMGVTYVIWRDEIRSIHYGPSEGDNKLRCGK